MNTFLVHRLLNAAIAADRRDDHAVAGLLTEAIEELESPRASDAPVTGETFEQWLNDTHPEGWRADRLDSGEIDLARKAWQAARASMPEHVKPEAKLVTFDEFVQYGINHRANVVIRHILVLALLAGAAYGGMRYEAVKIQQTCEDPDAGTVLNGKPYVCLTLERATALRKRLYERGV